MKVNILWVGMLLLLAEAGSAQLNVPRLGDTLGQAESIANPTLQSINQVSRDAAALAQARVERLADFGREHRDVVELDDQGMFARRGEVLMLDPSDTVLATARVAGFAVIERGQIDALDVSFARLATPQGTRLADAMRALRHAIPGKTITSDPLHFVSATAVTRIAPVVMTKATLPHGGTVGVIDGGMGANRLVAAQQGFAVGAPAPNGHAAAIGSLLAGAGVTRIVVADVYGHDPAGGNALAIARALGWMVGQHVPVVSISLVGPPNALLARAVDAATARGCIIVAAVGNDGPAAPPAFPASYPPVVAVTGVDVHNHVLIEAGHAMHLDYAAPGADMSAIGLNGRTERLRGTSYAAPLAAARIAAYANPHLTRADILTAVNAEAINPSRSFGHGLLCATCRTGK